MTDMAKARQPAATAPAPAPEPAQPDLLPPDLGQDIGAVMDAAQATAAGQQAAEPQPDPVQPVAQPVQQQPSAIVDWFRNQGIDLDPNATEDTVRDLLNATLETNELVAKSLGDEVTAERLQALVESEQRLASVAPKLPDFEKWRQTQEQQAAAVQQQHDQQRRWAPLKPVADYEWGLLTQQPNGAYKANSPQYAEVEERANALVRRDREMRFLQATDPDAYFEACYGFKPSEVTALRKAQEDLQKTQQQQVQQHAAERELQKFYGDHSAELFKVDPATGQYANTEAGDIFFQKWEEIARTRPHLAEKDARELALEMAKLATNIAVVGTPQQPAAAQKPFRRRLERAPRPTDVAGQQPGTAPKQDLPFDPSMGIDGIWDQAEARAKAAMLGK